MNQSARKPTTHVDGGKALDEFMDSVADAWANLGPKDEKLSPLDGPAALLLYLSMLVARRSNREYQTHLGVSTPVVRLLFNLRERAPCTLKQLVESTGMDKAQVSRTMAAMLKDGYIGFSGPLEKPTRFTALTKAVLAPRGEELLERALVVARPLHMEMLQTLAPSERRMFYKVLRRLIAKAEEWETAPTNVHIPSSRETRPMSTRRASSSAKRRIKAR